ncbi:MULTISPECIES: oligopeptide ABC transporter permease [Globicatella]|uniref:Peptide/nickel transport system permease protein n=1 Tax=Globicatella sulfidifaciens DSM 15739 TaxID=1121925 RepID=A0A1T4M0F5_9LACT|nr:MULTISPECIES: oligopeptide ABC transporter permease [Globicatella]MDK7631293.1 ABC transporter permease [Globicatella sanguinis]MDT2768696.1 ABC transporter permease [Globicatella sulfidifaciens]WIK66937.1 ABC transporter permease [Globicatella sanguinis]WKT56342.1 ABC transporter permease [Globicatella sanguinis]SJZ60392.1 peptide/nickel transport system permease protein [Globicatella sulfidifaciens DSM 15739]
MWKTILRRIVLMLPQLFILTILVFALSILMPGDALTGTIDPTISAAQLEAMREKLGLNKPWYERYIDWMKGVLVGDFGRSWKYKQPVLSIIGQRVWPTIWLSLFTAILTYLIALPLGLLAGRYQDSWIDRTINLYNFISYSMPSFVLGLLMIWLFGYTLKWFPTRGTISSGVTPGTIQAMLSRLYHIILPGTTLALISTTGTIQYLRTGIIDAKSQDYVRTARAKGVPEAVVYRRHIFRNSLLPIAAFMGYTITGLVSGAVITENIFTYQGMGRLFLDSISGRDFSVMMTLVLFFGFMTLLGTLLSDIIMVFVDPRIRID